MENKNYIGWLVLTIVVIAIFAGFTAFYKFGNDNGTVSYLDGFAQCIASKKLTMYGAEWCPHCKNEKAQFGSAFKYVPYVECPQNQQLCLDKGVKGYPTWITEDGKLYEGEQGLENISRISGCPLEKK